MSLTKVSYSMINGAPINLLDEGAVMNDSSSASKAANKAALLSALATKRPVYVPSGTLWINGDIEFPQDGQLIGAGLESTFIKGDGDLFKITTGSATGLWQNFTIENATTRGKLFQLNTGVDTYAPHMIGVRFGKANYHIYAPDFAVVFHKLDMCQFIDADTHSRYYAKLWAYSETNCYTWYNQQGLYVTKEAFTCSINGSVFEQNNLTGIALDNVLNTEQASWGINDTHFEFNGKLGTPDVQINTSAVGRIRTVSFNSCSFHTPDAATTPFRVFINATGGGNIDFINFNGCTTIGAVPLCNDVSAAILDGCYFQSAPSFGNVQNHVVVPFGRNNYIGTSTVVGPNGGNGVVQATITPPSNCKLIQIYACGDTYNGGASGTSNAYLQAQVNVAAASVRSITDLDNSAGSNQGFTAVWSAGSVVVANKSGLSNNQNGFVTAVFYS